MLLQFFPLTFTIPTTSSRYDLQMIILTNVTVTMLTILPIMTMTMIVILTVMIIIARIMIIIFIMWKYIIRILNVTCRKLSLYVCF